MPVKRSSVKVLAFLCLGISTLYLIIACGEGGKITVSTQQYNGPGSKWNIELVANGAYQIQHRPDINSEIDMTIIGIYRKHITGFVSLEVTSSSGNNVPAIGSTSWALEVPGYAFLLKPFNGDQIVSMIEAGKCPDENIDANWVVVKKENISPDNAGADSTSRDFFGTFHFEAATNTPSLPSSYAIAGATALGPGIIPGTTSCSSGIMQVTDAAIYLTDNGGAIVHTGTDTANDESDDSFIFGLSQKAVSNINNLDGDYAGMLFDQSVSQAGDRIQPITITCTGGACIARYISDIVTGQIEPDTISIYLSGTVDALANGLVTGTVAEGTGPGPGIAELACMIDSSALNTEKKIISCVGQSPVTGEQSKMINVIFISK
ncbi:MAG: hypothetical protein OEZ38_00315 [Gammaproteobacteria bacterium]|nr:hypothetical protein [Gammaproteobacteria bacterium]